MRVLPSDAPLTSSGGVDSAGRTPGPRRLAGRKGSRTRTLREIVTMLSEGLEAAEEIGEALLAGRARANLAKGAARRTRRLPRPHPGGAQARGRLRGLPLDGMAAGERARRLAPALRAPARPQLLALAARTRGGPAALRPHHSPPRSWTRCRPAPPTGETSRPFSPPRRARWCSRGHGATATAASWGEAPCSRDSRRRPTCDETPGRRTPSARPTG